MAIRWGTEQDKRACAAIESECGLWHDEIDFEAALCTGIEWLVLEDDDPQGTILGHVVAVVDRARIWIDTVAVKPTRQRQGVGRRLVEHLLAMDGGREIASAPVDEKKPVALEFFGKLGFEDRGLRVAMQNLFGRRVHGFAAIVQRGLAPVDPEFDMMITGKRIK
jgi:ribosomal protein S18 acetylase RimI-like enzyme